MANLSLNSSFMFQIWNARGLFELAGLKKKKEYV